MKRVILLVIDGFGIGAADDAAAYGDENSNTYRALGTAAIPTMVSLGLNEISGIRETEKGTSLGAYARLAEKSAGKDTTTGHFELAGLVVKKPFPTYPDGFPPDIVKRLEKAFGKRILGNKAASGTRIINELGDFHMKSGEPIVYTSADSVLQIACHESVYSVSELYSMCEKARLIMSGEHGVSRIIARPFVGSCGNYSRTARRKDFSLPPFGKTMLDRLCGKFECAAVGKIYDIFCGRGITARFDAHDNEEAFYATLDAMKSVKNGLIFANFVDTDMLYGHRNDADGYRLCLERFDEYLARFISEMKIGDALVITADHGCDPSTPSTDHSREDVPLLIYGACLNPLDLGKIRGFDCVSDFVIDYLEGTKKGLIAQKIIK